MAKKTIKPVLSELNFNGSVKKPFDLAGDEATSENISNWFEDYILDNLFDSGEDSAVEGFEYFPDRGVVFRTKDHERFFVDRAAGPYEQSVYALMQAILFEYGAFPVLFSKETLDKIQAGEDRSWENSLIDLSNFNVEDIDTANEKFESVLYTMVACVGNKLWEAGVLEGSEYEEDWKEILINYGYLEEDE